MQEARVHPGRVAGEPIEHEAGPREELARQLILQGEGRGERGEGGRGAPWSRDGEGGEGGEGWRGAASADLVEDPRDEPREDAAEEEGCAARQQTLLC